MSAEVVDIREGKRRRDRTRLTELQREYDGLLTQLSDLYMLRDEVRAAVRDTETALQRASLSLAQHKQRL